MNEQLHEDDRRFLEDQLVLVMQCIEEAQPSTWVEFMIRKTRGGRIDRERTCVKREIRGGKIE